MPAVHLDTQRMGKGRVGGAGGPREGLGGCLPGGKAAGPGLGGGCPPVRGTGGRGCPSVGGKLERGAGGGCRLVLMRRNRNGPRGNARLPLRFILWGKGAGKGAFLATSLEGFGSFQGEKKNLSRSLSAE